MAQIVIEIADASLADYVDSVSAHFGYRAVIGVDDQGADIPNPQTRQEFVLGKIAAFATVHYRERKVNVEKIAIDAKADQAVADLALTVQLK